MKKETLEEAALAIIPDKSTPGWIDTHSAIERRGFIKGAKWQAEQEYAEYLADETKKWDNAQSELEAYRQHRRSSEYQEKKLKFKQELNDAMHEAHQTGRVINQEQSAFVKKDDVDGEWLSPVATERAWQEEQLVNIFGHYPNASPRWQYMNSLIQNSLQAERMYSEEDIALAFNEGQAYSVTGKLVDGKEWVKTHKKEWFEQFKKE